MAQKMELNEMSFLISGGGRIDENKPIKLQDHVAPAFVEKGAVEIKSIAPKAITLPDEKEIVAAMEEIRNTPLQCGVNPHRKRENGVTQSDHTVPLLQLSLRGPRKSVL